VPEEFSGRGQALAWFEAENPVMLGLLTKAIADGDDQYAWQITWTLAPFFYRRGRWHECITIQRQALQAAQRLRDPVGLGHAHYELGRGLVLTGDFAEAYVVAHEVGHHIQNLTGITSRIAAAGQASSSADNALSVRAELQADCFAGVWAHSTYERHLLDAGDIEEALHAAQVVGDDFLARARGAAVDPDSWTHGSSAQRQQWFTSGYKDGRPDACDTFAASP